MSQGRVRPCSTVLNAPVCSVRDGPLSGRLPPQGRAHTHTLTHTHTHTQICDPCQLIHGRVYLWFAQCPSFVSKNVLSLFFFLLSLSPSLSFGCPLFPPLHLCSCLSLALSISEGFDCSCVWFGTRPILQYCRHLVSRLRRGSCLFAFVCVCACVRACVCVFLTWTNVG